MEIVIQRIHISEKGTEETLGVKNKPKTGHM